MVVQTVAPEPNLAHWQNLFDSFAFYFVNLAPEG